MRFWGLPLRRLSSGRASRAASARQPPGRAAARPLSLARDVRCACGGGGARRRSGRPDASSACSGWGERQRCGSARRAAAEGGTGDVERSMDGDAGERLEEEQQIQRPAPDGRRAARKRATGDRTASATWSAACASCHHAAPRVTCRLPHIAAPLGQAGGAGGRCSRSTHCINRSSRAATCVPCTLHCACVARAPKHFAIDRPEPLLLPRDALVQRGERLVAEPHVHRADRLLGRRQHLRPLCHPSARTLEPTAAAAAALALREAVAVACASTAEP